MVSLGEELGETRTRKTVIFQIVVCKLNLHLLVPEFNKVYFGNAVTVWIITSFTLNKDFFVDIHDFLNNLLNSLNNDIFNWDFSSDDNLLNLLRHHYLLHIADHVFVDKSLNWHLNISVYDLLFDVFNWFFDNNINIDCLDNLNWFLDIKKNDDFYWFFNDFLDNDFHLLNDINLLLNDPFSNNRIFNNLHYLFNSWY